MAWEHGRIRYFREKTSAPTINDDENDGYRESDVWVDETNNKAYMCLDASAGSADWNQIDAGAGVDVDTLIADVKEANVSAVKKGQPCAIVGSSGAKFEVQLADCDNVNLIRLLGIAEVDTAQNETGTVIHKGLLLNVDTQTTNSDLNPGAETWATGEMLYVSQTPGGLTKTRPTSGRCIKACRSLKGNSASDTLLAIVHTNPICACAAAGEDVCSRMGDSAGANKHSFKDYANNEVAAIDSNGNLTLDGTINLVGGQIAFPATAVPSADPNTLDDYEVGTWTPVGTLAVPGDSSNDGQVGKYQKVGDWVSVVGLTVFTKGTGTGGFTITGMPFGPVTGTHIPVNLWVSGIGAANETLTGLVVGNTTNIAFYQIPESTAASTTTQHGDLGAEVMARCTCTFPVI